MLASAEKSARREKNSVSLPGILRLLLHTRFLAVATSAFLSNIDLSVGLLLLPFPFLSPSPSRLSAGTLTLESRLLRGKMRFRHGSEAREKVARVRDILLDFFGIHLHVTCRKIICYIIVNVSNTVLGIDPLR